MSTKSKSADAFDDEELRERILQLVRAGNHPLVAAESMGVRRRTWFRWRERAQAGRKQYVAFADALAQAVAECEARDVVTAQRASVVDKQEITCEQCGHVWLEDPVRMLHVTGFTESAMRIKGMAAQNSLQRLSLRFPKRWSQRVLHTIEEEHHRLLDVAQRVLEPKVFELLLENYLAETSGEDEAGAGPGEPPPERVH